MGAGDLRAAAPPRDEKDPDMPNRRTVEPSDDGRLEASRDEDAHRCGERPE